MLLKVYAFYGMKILSIHMAFHGAFPDSINLFTVAFSWRVI